MGAKAIKLHCRFMGQTSYKLLGLECQCEAYADYFGSNNIATFIRSFSLGKR